MVRFSLNRCLTSEDLAACFKDTEVFCEVMWQYIPSWCHHSSRPMKRSLSRKWGRRRERMGPRGDPARLYASSTLTPWDRSVRRALPQLSLPPHDVTRMMLRGVSNMPNLRRISPSWDEKLCRGGVWIISFGKSLNHKVKMGRLAGCCCEHLRGPLARASVGSDDGVPAEHDSELLWWTGSYLLVQHHRENTWTNDKETKSPSNITLTDQYLLNWTFRRKLHKLKGIKSHYYIISSSTIFQIPASDRDWSAVKTPGGSHPSHISSNKWQKKKKLPDHSVMPAAPRFCLLSGRAARYFSVNSQWNHPRWRNRTCRHRGL